jgi:hypothetical protein
MLDSDKYPKIEDGENIDVKIIDSLVKVKGTRPTSGTLIIEKGRVKKADLCIDGFNVEYNGAKAKATDSEYKAVTELLKKGCNFFDVCCPKYGSIILINN